MKTKKYLSLLLAGAMCASLLAGCGAGKEDAAGAPDAGKPDDTAAVSELQAIKDAGKIKIGYTEYPPINFTDEATGELTGFDTEFAKAVSEKLGVEADFIEIVWDTKNVELESGNIDCIWNGMTITDDLKAAFAISDPYAQNTQVVITKAENKDTYADYANLEGKTVVVEAGSAAQSVAEEDEHLKNANIVTVTKQTDALLEVKSGTADAAIFDQTMADTMLGEGTDFADLTVCGIFHKEEYGIAFRKDSDLCTEVNKIMAELKEDGTLPALAEKYGLTLA
ncbi:transporter substrate-binding domain-containing protein [Agathobaculum sp.]|uniref:transporter substrate-binding domain-containing protein n=1 Tax=Agathobaculum sp. TaxID=2048138 RepID=UPI002A7F8772|nr:transporter substrate-binding domain-containing protein [Agathobaculum sp.]MDY3619100.1 transporter substrate-binding domain-containing protein [Agathobaculum sp.]